MKKNAFILLFLIMASVPLYAEAAVKAPYAASETFVMTEYSEWAGEYIQKAVDENILTKDMRSGYKEYINRQHFCEIVYNMLTKWGIDSISASEVFKDTDSMEVNTLYAMGIVNGKGENYFKPDDSLTREEAATILTRVALLMEIKMSASDYKFDDDEDISDWAKEAVYKMHSCGVMNGVSESSFSPKSKYTKEQAVVTVIRLFESAK